MRRIWKYQVIPERAISIEMPLGAQVLTVQAQRDEINVWALVDPEAPRVWRRFRLIGTGHIIQDGALQYIGTFQLDCGALVFHLFEEVLELL